MGLAPSIILHIDSEMRVCVLRDSDPGEDQARHKEGTDVIGEGGCNVRRLLERTQDRTGLGEDTGAFSAP